MAGELRVETQKRRGKIRRRIKRSMKVLGRASSVWVYEGCFGDKHNNFLVVLLSLPPPTSDIPPTCYACPRCSLLSY